MKVARCIGCGQVRSEMWMWNELESCSSCGGAIERPEEDLGQREQIPRVLKWGGILLLIVSMILIVYGNMNSSAPGSILTTALLIIVCASVFLIISLAYGHSLSKEACRLVAEASKKRPARGRLPIRRPRINTPGDEEEVTSGKVQTARGTKILPGK